MKKHLFIIFLLTSLSSVAQSLNTNNLIYTGKPKKAVKEEDFGNLKPSEIVQSVTYFDGLGRPMQTIAIGQGGNGEDIITPITYDGFGRQDKDYLPYPAASTGAYRTDAFAKVDDFYKQLYPNEISSVTPNPYSQKEFEASPLSRVLQQAAPGNDWSLSNNRTIKMDYQINTATEVKLFQVATVWDTPVAGLYNPTLSQSTTYGLGQLYKTITKDENWTANQTNLLDNTTEEFKDKEGRVVLKRTYNNNIAHDTYYVYDMFGNLTYVIPPLANGAFDAATLNELCYQYKYDYRNRLVEKKLPGKQWEYIVYDKLDRVVATGPVLSPFNDITQLGWSVIKYDAFSRPVLTAWMPATTVTSADRKALQDTQNAITTNFSETKNATTDTTINGVPFRYSNMAWPISGYHVLTVSYFDDYNYPDAPVIPAAVETEPVYYNSTVQPKGLPTGAWTRVVQASTDYTNELSYSLYDSIARPIRTYTKTFLGGYTYVDSKLDFTGKPEYTITYHKRVPADNELITKEVFTYSPQDRLLTQTHQIGTATPELLVKNEYDELGQLKAKEVGAKTQKIDYTYNIRGWLTEINKVAALQQGTDPKDLFGFKINYNTVSSGIAGVTSLYNGNIAETQWATSYDNTVRTYGYKYDALNRLNEALYKKGSVVNAYDEKLTYDANGNIKTLTRYGSLNDTTPVLIDDLTYAYKNTASNQLTNVTDTKANNASFTNEFKDSASANDYTYDANGNMTMDNNKGITAINYNHLNLPTKLFFGSNTIEYIYNATGQKVQKKVIEGATTTVTHYLSGFQYKNDVLQFFPHAEGYVNMESSAPEYIFNYKDHLGNVRLSYQDKNKNGTIASYSAVISVPDPSCGKCPFIDVKTSIQEVLEENNYYPFGLKHSGYNNNVTSTNPGQKYKFQNKEWQDELSLNLYDFGGRLYDPAIVRTTTHDPLAEKFYNLSPQSFLNNNPLSFIDPTGMSSDWFDKKAEKTAQATEKQIDKKIAELNKGSAADKQDRISQLNKSKSDISDMRNDKNNEYKFDKASNNGNAPETKRTGANEITIFTDDAAKQIHENRHGGQIARGEYDIDMSGSVTSGTFGVSKEIDAYNAQYSFEGKIEYIPLTNFSSQSNIMKFATQGVNAFKKTITNMGQINNTFIQSLVDNPGLNQTPIYPDPAVNPTYYKQ